MKREILMSALALLAVGATSAARSADCPVTLVNDGKGGHYQNDALKVGLWSEGKVTFFTQQGPGFIDADGSLAMKFWWWRLKPGQLQIEGRRLDAEAPPLRANIPEGYGGKGFQATGLVFPTVGCWEVTGRLGEDSITFVTLVEKVDGPPPWLAKR